MKPDDYLYLTTADVLRGGPGFTKDTVMPWLYELYEQRARFTVPPLLSVGAEPPFFDVKLTRWADVGATPEICYYAATDPDGIVPVIKDGKVVLVWAPTPVPVPMTMFALAKIQA